MAFGKIKPGIDSVTMTKYKNLLNISTIRLVLLYAARDAGLIDPEGKKIRFYNFFPFSSLIFQISLTLIDGFISFFKEYFQIRNIIAGIYI